jgi:hypothetical protein
MTRVERSRRGRSENTVRGHHALVTWAEAMGPERRLGIERSPIVRRGSRPAPRGYRPERRRGPSDLTARERRSLRRAGKSDAGDALAIARVALREPHLGPVPMPGLSEDLEWPPSRPRRSWVRRATLVASARHPRSLP